MSIRSNTMRMGLVALAAAALAALLVVLLFPGTGTTAATQSPSSIVNLVSAYDMSGEVSTSSSDGIRIFNRNVIPPSNANTLWISFSGTGDSHDGNATRLGCRVDGHGCPNDDNSWTEVQKFNFQPLLDANELNDCEGDGGGGCGDWHDNNINLTWCQSILPGSGHKNVQVWLSADEDGEGTVYVEKATFTVNAGFTPHGCQEFDMNSVAGVGSSPAHGG